MLFSIIWWITAVIFLCTVLSMTSYEKELRKPFLRSSRGRRKSRACDSGLVLPVDTKARVWAIVETGFYFCLRSATSILSGSPALPLHFHRAGWKLEWNKDVSNGWRQPVSERERGEREWSKDERKDMKAICRFENIDLYSTASLCSLKAIWWWENH